MLKNSNLKFVARFEKIYTNKHIPCQTLVRKCLKINLFVIGKTKLKEIAYLII